MTAIDALRKAAKGKAFDEEKAESDIGRCVETYRTGYRPTDAEQKWLRQLAAGRKTIAQGKARVEKMRRHIDKLRKDAVALSDREYRSTLFCVGSIYENMKWSEDKPGWETVAGELGELIRTLDQIDSRMQAFTSRRVPSSRKLNRVERLTLDLANVYRGHTGREPASGSHGIDWRGGSPFVLFVQEVLRQCAPREAKREALGQSVYMWLREDREFRSLMAYLEEHGG